MYNDNVDYSEVYDIHLNFVIQNINDNLNIKLNKKLSLFLKNEYFITKC